MEELAHYGAAVLESTSLHLLKGKAITNYQVGQPGAQGLMAANWLPDTPHPTPAPRQRAEAGAGKEHREAAAHPEAACGWRSLRGHLARCRPHSAWSPLPTGLPRAAPPASGAQLKCPLLGEPSPTSRPSVTPSLTPLWFIFLHVLITSEILTLARLLTCLFSVSPREAVSPGTGILPVLASAEAPRLVQDPTHSRCSINTVEWMVRGNQVYALSGDL